ncbi:MAG TPA: hypothetical protein ENN28_01120 [Candidatus Uhrbacteria bacterium]|nr:hypothetical protein [Candidatus Uhrbacteria bacterium]
MFAQRSLTEEVKNDKCLPRLFKAKSFKREKVRILPERLPGNKNAGIWNFYDHQTKTKQGKRKKETDNFEFVFEEYPDLKVFEACCQANGDWLIARP